jgi:hypothetical protein
VGIDLDEVARCIGEPETAARGWRDARGFASAELQPWPPNAEARIDREHPASSIQREARFTTAARLGPSTLQPQNRD